MTEQEIRSGIIEALGGAYAKPLPSDEERNSAYEAELVRRFHAGEPLTATDKREARRLLAQSA